MPKSLNDILKGVKKSTTAALTTGDVPGVDYADKMKDGRDFVAQHSIEKHADRVGNDDKVYKGSTKKAEMKRHGHEPMPKDIQVYNKTQQVGEEVDLEETKKPEVSIYDNAAHVKDSQGKVVASYSKKTHGSDFVKRANAHMARLSEAKMCENCGKSPCSCDTDDEPKDNGKKDKPGKRKLLTDKKLQEKITKSTSAGEVISDFVNSDNPKFDGKSKEERKKMALGAYYGMHPEKSKKKVEESISDQRSSRKTSSEEARKEIHKAIMRKKEKEEKMKEEAAATETPITFPVTNSREGFRV